MENINQQTPDYTPPAEPKKWFQSGWFSRGFLLVAGLFFFLPFIDIKCSGTKLASVKGSDMIFGSELKVNQEVSNEEGADSTASESESDGGAAGFNLGAGPMEQGDNKHIAPNALAIGAFASVIIALIFSFFAKRLPVILGGGFALLAALALFFIQFQVHNEVETKLGPFMLSAITFEFTAFYWCCLLFLALAAIFGFVRGAAAKAGS